MWQDKLKEIIYILENSDVNEIEATFWGKKFRVVKNSPNILGSSLDKITTLETSQSSVSDNKEKVSDKENEKSKTSQSHKVKAPKSQSVKKAKVKASTRQSVRSRSVKLQSLAM